jgi:hypothetical protein
MLTKAPLFGRTLRFGRGGQDQQQWSPTMTRLAALFILAVLTSLPAAAQNKGKSPSAPGVTGATPGQQGTAPGSAPGSQSKGALPGTGKDFAPGQDQRAVTNPNKPIKP